MTSEIVIAQTTIDNENQAKALARSAVERRLAACALSRSEAARR
ncbi:divalent cation tolerance protein CutA [Streptomyces sp. A 4/2]